MPIHRIEFRVTEMPTAGLKQAPSLFVAAMQQRRVRTTENAAASPYLSPAVCLPLIIRITEMKIKVHIISLMTTCRSIE